MQTITSFSLSIDGLFLSYSANNVSNSLKLDPAATCNLFQELHIIEGFDVDKNGEPVILFTASEGSIKTTGFCLWCDFVKTYPFDLRHAGLIADHHASQSAYKRIINKINRLAAPAYSPKMEMVY